MRGHKQLMASASDEWETNQKIFDALNKEFKFNLDVCATALNAKCKNYLTIADNALAQSWKNKRCFMNPPFSNIKQFMRKAHEESASNGATVVCLIAARTDTQSWWDYVLRANEIRFITGRLTFGNAKSGATFPSAIVIFRPTDCGNHKAISMPTSWIHRDELMRGISKLSSFAFDAGRKKTESTYKSAKRKQKSLKTRISAR